MKKILIIVFITTAITVFAIQLKTKQDITDAQKTSSRTPVVASFYPLAYFAQEIGGNRVTVSNITPSGAEPHDYEPSTTDIQRIAESKLLILNGLGLESWGNKIQNKNILTVSDGIAKNDPHVWLDPVLAQQVVVKIADALQAVSPDDRQYFEFNKEKLLDKLSVLNSDFAKGLSKCSKHDIVTSHSAFGYVASRYGFTQIAIAGLSPDEEPTPQKLTEVTNIVQQKHIQYIFFETLVSSRLAQTIATETNAQVLVFNPLEGLTPSELNMGEDYFSIQRENLKNLRTALSCM